MHPHIADSERLAIFVFDSDKMRADGAHWKAFRPDDRGERSFFRIDGLEYAAIAQIGKDVGAETGRTLHGWAIVQAGKVRPPLMLKADEPPDRHGVIVGWPTERNDQRSLAQVLAGIAEETVQFSPRHP
jgi:hypothetical protein